MPCDPNDVNIALPDGPSGSPLSAFGLPFALPTPNLSLPLGDFPENLLELLDKLQLLIPPGALKPQLSLNSGKDILDGVLKLLDQFTPFLMMYKFFLPILKLILCIIEIICAIPNPFKLIKAINNLFRNCIPEFLNMFPIFALIIMIISLLLLLLALIEYIIAQILKLIEAILRNINALIKAFSDADENSVLAIAQKLGALLCIFQNIFVLLSIFTIIIQIIKDILNLLFKIPPCDNSDKSNANNCCTTDVCPAIIANGDYTLSTGTFQYLRALSLQPTTPIPGLPTFSSPYRSESWVIYDTNQTQAEAFINIIDAYDVPATTHGVFHFGRPTKPVFFPTDTNYSATTPPQQSVYTADLRLFYNPISWGRFTIPTFNSPNINNNLPRYIRFNNCIITKIPSRTLTLNDGSHQTINDGVLILAGGQGYEDDGYTILTGYADDGITKIDDQATLENFIHKPDRSSNTGTIIPIPTDGYIFSDITYTFRPNFEALLSKQLITLGCEPSVALNRDFINTAFAGDAGFKAQQIADIVNSRNGNIFPNPKATQDCLEAALVALRTNMTPAGVAVFQATATICLNQLKDDTQSALTSIIPLGFEACNSDFTLTPTTQFTTKPIKVKVDLKERNGLSIATGLPIEVANNLADQIKSHPSFGSTDKFVYDGYGSFIANLSSNFPGKGEMMISFDDNIFCLNNIPTDNTVSPTHDLKTIAYQFVYTPSSGGAVISDATSDGAPRRDEGDIARDSSNNGSSDGGS